MTAASHNTTFTRLDIASSRLRLLNQANAQNPADNGQAFSGGTAMFSVWADGTVSGATFNGCTVTLQFSPDNAASWIPYDNVGFVSNGSAIVRLKQGWRIRALITDAIPTGINAELDYLPSD